ncbi:hypothetical protein BSKO_05413 [Bryopsis sp. KO-2023]|nr:hypothetical protein BSKO_05413 [Bryopsis sp. KO-2023]
MTDRRFGRSPRSTLKPVQVAELLAFREKTEWLGKTKAFFDEPWEDVVKRFGGKEDEEGDDADQERAFVVSSNARVETLESHSSMDFGDPVLVVEDGHGVTVREKELTPGMEERGQECRFSIIQYSPLEATLNSPDVSLLLCWQVTDDSGDMQTWFQASDEHSLKKNESVVKIKGVHNLVDGIHLVDGVFGEQGKNGTTLFFIKNIEKVGEVVVWQGGSGALVEEICNVNLRKCVTVVERLEKKSLPIPMPLFVEVENEESSESSEEDFVPFDSESYGLSDPSVSDALLSACISMIQLEVQKGVFQIAHTLRFVTHSDRSGTRTAMVLAKALLKGVEQGLMQRGDALCLVVQKMVECVLGVVPEIQTSPLFQGGVVMEILYCLDEIYRSVQVNGRTQLLEAAPSNIFAHMDGTAETAATLGAKIVSMAGTGASNNVPAPYVAEMEVPNLDNIDPNQIRHLFRNAPHLSGLQKEMCTPKALRKIDGYIGQRKSGKLRKYQEHCVDKVTTGGNFVFVAPTGAGKTKIFVEAARYILEAKHEGTVVVICPTVPLATQQASVFVVEGFLQERFWVNVFSSDNPLKPETWEIMRRTHNVMVMTPQLLLNVMEFVRTNNPIEEGNAIFYGIDLLVLDECHHTRKEHAFNKIMREYKETPGCRMQVLGFTASPAKSKTEEECREELGNLLGSLDATMVVITEDNDEVKAFVPGASELEAWTEPRKEDSVFARALGAYVMKACRNYLLPLVGKVEGVRKLQESCMVDFACGRTSTFFESWVRTCGESVEANKSLKEFEKIDLVASFHLIRCCNTALDLLTDAGFESAMRYLAKKTTELSLTFAGDPDFQSWIYPKLVAGLYCLQPIQQISTVLQAFHVSPEGLSQRFPRFVELVKFLLEYSKQQQFHGIVFVKTRDGVYHLGSMLRNHPQLRFLTPIEFIGHGRTQRKNNTKAAYLDPTAATNAVRGMSGSKQRDTLEAFSKPGRHVLIATSAAEEGINVPTCEFVVRYSVTETGIQRVQSRGRTRVKGAVFLNILERESKGSQLYRSAVRQEEILTKVLKASNSVEHV